MIGGAVIKSPVVVSTLAIVVVVLIVVVVVVAVAEVVVTSVKTLLMFMLHSTWILFVRPIEKTFHWNPAWLFEMVLKMDNRLDKNFQVILEFYFHWGPMVNHFPDW